MGQVGTNQARGDTLDGVADQAGSLANEYRLTLGSQVCRASTIGGGRNISWGLVGAGVSAVAGGGAVDVSGVDVAAGEQAARRNEPKIIRMSAFQVMILNPLSLNNEF